MRIKNSFRLMAVGALLLLVAVAHAQVPPYINYQGQLLDAGGNPANGSFTIVFSIFEVANGGTALFTETQAITVTNGLFNALIGSVTPIPDTLFDSGPNRWLEITANGTVLTPRRRFASVPYAFNTRDNGAASGPWLTSGNVVYYNNGDVGVGTADPRARVHSQSTGNIPSFLAGGSSADLAVPGNNQAMQFGSCEGSSSTFTEWMRIGAAGNVGIGTPDPGVFPGAAKYLTLSASDDYVHGRLAALELQGSTSSSTDPVARIDFSSVGPSGSNNLARIHAEPGVSSLLEGELVFFTHNGASINETMRINQDGYVGINTTTPSDFLEVVGGVDITRTTNATALDIQHSGLLTNALVNIETASGPPLGTNLLQIKAGSAIAPDAQFIECTSGTDAKFRVNGDGDVTADGQFTGGGADFAEMMEITSGAASVAPGDVLVIDPSNPRSLIMSSTARSTLVAGIYSTRPGFIGTERRLHALVGEEPARIDLAEENNEIPLAVVGIVPCRVSAENGAIRPGHLLVTSSTPGHAMRDDDPKNGTVLGKALGSLDAGTGVIKVLVTLQ